MSNNQDIIEMLDTLKLPTASQRFQELLKSPDLGNYDQVQFLRELLTPQYIEALNNRFAANLRTSGLINKSAQIENLKTGNGRMYNDTTVQQILTFDFAEDRQNVGVYGITGAGKSYFLAALCVEACRRNFRSKFIDYSDLLDELIMLNRQNDLNRYRKKIRYYARMQLLFIDDFAISRYSDEGMKILYHLIKMRDDLGTSTLFSCQYSPDEWGKYLSDEPECYGKLDGIRRRLTTGFTVLIEKAGKK
jgi:DNA replication protein DnaC